MADLVVMRSPAASTPRGLAALVAGQVRYADRQFWRTPVAAFFTVVLPPILLLLVGLTAGNETIDGQVRIAQFFTPSLLAFGVAMATYTSPAMAMAIAREQGVLKRLRGTPLPGWAFLAGRMGSALLVALLSAAVTLTIAVVFLGVQIVTSGMAAGVVTFLLGVITFGALAFAVAAVFHSSMTVQAVTSGSVIALGFVSEIFIVAETMPRWLLLVGDLFPLKHFANGLQDAFNPYLAGSRWGWQHLAVMGAWAVGAAAIAVWRFDWQPHRRAPAARPERQEPAGSPVMPTHPPVVESGPPRLLAMLGAQVAYANRALWRDFGSVFFAIAMPVLLILLLPAVFGSGQVEFGERLRLPQLLAPGMAVYGIAVHAFVNMPEAVASARERGVLKRLRGTPLPPRVYLAGRLGSVLLVAAIIATATLAAGALAHDFEVPAGRLAAGLLTFLVGTAGLTALGFMVAAVVPNARSVPVIALAFLLPLAFVSDIFLLTDLPPVLAGIGWAFPLKHFVHAMVAAFNSAAPHAGLAWDHLAVMLVWGVAGVVVAARTFRWE